MTRPAPDTRASLVVVGAGPRGTGLLERIAANAPEPHDGRGLDIHLVDPHPQDGVSRVTSTTVPGAAVQARAPVEARLPHPTVERARDPLPRALHADGAGPTPDGLPAVDRADGRVPDRDGRPRPRRFALGPHTDARGSGAFTRPRTGGVAFRQNDATARALPTFLIGYGSCEARPGEDRAVGAHGADRRG
ncbi:hypothetical protein C4J65_05555 [Streptomyces sp. CB09001]|nr:hypothetical protein C4J65_05555 [Streptomyces sp. CB09001]